MESFAKLSFNGINIRFRRPNNEEIVDEYRDIGAFPVIENAVVSVKGSKPSVLR
jgi:hypothetical protein